MRFDYRREGDLMMEIEIRVKCFEDGGKGHELRECKKYSTGRWKSQGNGFSLEPQ